MFNLISLKCLFPCLQRIKISKIEFNEKELVIKKAGGKYMDLELVVDGNIVTSRCPGRHPFFHAANDEEDQED